MLRPSMTSPPVIFISAVSKELKSARQIVANQLTALGYQPQWQDIFGTEAGDLTEMLRRQVDESSGVIQLVGQSYGFEPKTPDPVFGQVSYTQYEALYARQQGKRVWYLLLDEKFPADPRDSEPRKLRRLQNSYRRRIRTDAHVWHAITSVDSLQLAVRKLRDDLAGLRWRARLWLAAVIALLLVVIVGVFWNNHGQKQQGETLQGVTNQIALLDAKQEQLREALRALPQAIAQATQAGDKYDPKDSLARAYSDLDQ
jgi:hypothetical protein